MKPLIVEANQGTNYDWSKDHIYIKTPLELTDGRVTLAEDVLKPGFDLARHHHKAMVEIFYILEGSIHFRFDDHEVTATRGMTLTIPPHVWHQVSTAGGGKLLTIFTPGGFDHYLSEIAKMSPEALASEEGMRLLGERYDIWTT